MFAASTAKAQEVTADAAHVLRARQADVADIASLQEVQRYDHDTTFRVGLVRATSGLYAVARWRLRPRDQWSLGFRHVHAGPGGMPPRIEVVSRDRRIFAVHHTLPPEPAPTGRCHCTAPGGDLQVTWLMVSSAGVLVRLLDYDPDVGSASWNEAAARVTIVQRSGPVRCPSGCEPAPAVQLIHRRKLELRGDRMEPVSEDFESRYTA